MQGQWFRLPSLCALPSSSIPPPSQVWDSTTASLLSSHGTPPSAPSHPSLPNRLPAATQPSTSVRAAAAGGGDEDGGDGGVSIEPHGDSIRALAVNPHDDSEWLGPSTCGRHQRDAAASAAAAASPAQPCGETACCRTMQSHTMHGFGRCWRCGRFIACCILRSLSDAPPCCAP